MTRKEIENKLKEIRPELKAKYNVSKIGLFGSYLDGTANENSDIDILVEFNKPVGWKFLSLEIYLENIFGKKVDLVTTNSIKKQLKKSILNNVLFL